MRSWEKFKNNIKPANSADHPLFLDRLKTAGGTEIGRNLKTAAGYSLVTTRCFYGSTGHQLLRHWATRFHINDIFLRWLKFVAGL